MTNLCATVWRSDVAAWSRCAEQASAPSSQKKRRHELCGASGAQLRPHPSSRAALGVVLMPRLNALDVVPHTCCTATTPHRKNSLNIINLFHISLKLRNRVISTLLWYDFDANLIHLLADRISCKFQPRKWAPCDHSVWFGDFCSNREQVIRHRCLHAQKSLSNYFKMKF